MSYMKNYMMELTADDEASMVESMSKNSIHACKLCGEIKNVRVASFAFDVMFIVCDKCRNND